MSDSLPDTVDVVVIGGGPPGENAADYAHQGGLSVALVESELIGGECSYWACMPSKALLRPVEVLAAAKALPGITVADDLDLDQVLKRRDSFTSNHDDSGQEKWATNAGLIVIRGHGRLAGTKSVEIDLTGGGHHTIAVNHAVVLATGTCPSVPDLPGLRDANPWTSRDVTNLHEVPNRVIVIGGGVVGCEASTWLRGLGADVTLVVRDERLLSRNEPFAGELLADHMREVGIDLRLGAKIDKVRRDTPTRTDEGYSRGTAVTVTLDGNDITADELVIAAGRDPRSTGIGLDIVGLDEGGFLPTDDTLLVDGVDGEWLYAVGDINGRALLTHMGKYQARVAGDVIAARANGEPTDALRYAATSDHDRVPQVTFTDPQVASVGLTEAEARDKHHAVRCVEYDLANLAGTSLLRDGYMGRAKLVVDATSETLLGATFVGPEVAELLHAATVAVVGKVPLDVLWHAVPSYPTAAEIWLRLLEEWRQ